MVFFFMYFQVKEGLKYDFRGPRGLTPNSSHDVVDDVLLICFFKKKMDGKHVVHLIF
jgi:hypothetical protein